MTEQKTQMEVLNWIRDSVGKSFDTDGSYGSQCKDYANAYSDWLGHPLKPSDAAEAWTAEQDVFWTKVPYITDNVPLSGDIVVWGAWKENKYGHIAVIVDADKIEFRSVDQNWLNSNPNTGSPASIVLHNYTEPKVTGFLRPALGFSVGNFSNSPDRTLAIINFQKQIESLSQILPTLTDKQKEELADSVEKQKKELGLV